MFTFLGPLGNTVVTLWTWSRETPVRRSGALRVTWQILAFVTRKVFGLQILATLGAIPPGLVLTGRIHFSPLLLFIVDINVR